MKILSPALILFASFTSFGFIALGLVDSRVIPDMDWQVAATILNLNDGHYQYHTDHPGTAYFRFLTLIFPQGWENIIASDVIALEYFAFIEALKYANAVMLGVFAAISYKHFTVNVGMSTSFGVLWATLISTSPATLFHVDILRPELFGTLLFCIAIFFYFRCKSSDSILSGCICSSFSLCAFYLSLSTKIQLVLVFLAILLSTSIFTLLSRGRPKGDFSASISLVELMFLLFLLAVFLKFGPVLSGIRALADGLIVILLFIFSVRMGTLAIIVHGLIIVAMALVLPRELSIIFAPINYMSHFNPSTSYLLPPIDPGKLMNLWPILPVFFGLFLAKKYVLPSVATGVMALAWFYSTRGLPIWYLVTLVPGVLSLVNLRYKPLLGKTFLCLLIVTNLLLTLVVRSEHPLASRIDPSTCSLVINTPIYQVLQSDFCNANN